MTWFGDRLLKRGATANAALEEHLLLQEQARNGATAREPALVLLATDASGQASRRVHCFEDSDAAARFVKFWYPEVRDGSLLTFWLLADEPSRYDHPEWGVELLVLIRDGARPGIVYPFSFVDMGDVRDFLQEELERGLDPRSVLILWSIPARIHADSAGRVMLFPEALPEGMAAGNGAVTVLAEREMAEAPALLRAG